MQFYAIFFQLLYIIICVRASRVCILSVMWSKERHPIASLCFSLFWYFMCRQFWNSPGTGKACGWVPRSGIGHCLWNGLCYEFNEHTNPCWQGYYQCALTHGDWFIVVIDLLWSLCSQTCRTHLPTMQKCMCTFDSLYILWSYIQTACSKQVPTSAQTCRVV